MEYRTSRSNKSRILHYTIMLIIFALLFLFSDYSALELISNPGLRGLIDLSWFVCSIPVIVVYFQFRHSKRLVINEKGIYHVQKGHRIFLPWTEILSIQYEISNRGFTTNKEFLHIVQKNDKKRKKFHPIIGEFYCFALRDFYPTNNKICYFNNDLHQCLLYYSDMYKIKYENNRT